MECHVCGICYTPCFHEDPFISETNVCHLTPDQLISKTVEKVKERPILTVHVIPVGIENQPKH